MNQSVPQQSWYAAKVFHNRLNEAEQILNGAGYESYIAMQKVAVEKAQGSLKSVKRPLIRSLIFFRCTVDDITKISQLLQGKAMIYLKPGEMRQAAPIPDDQMNIFRLVTSIDDKLEYLGDSTEAYNVGQQVLVTGGPFEGAIGRIFRIKGDKRLVVSISGVCAVATSYIPSCFLKKL